MTTASKTADKPDKADKTTTEISPKERDRRAADELLRELASWRKNLQAQGLDLFAVLNFAAKSAFGVTAQPDPPEDDDTGPEPGDEPEAYPTLTLSGGQGADTVAGGQGADTLSATNKGKT